MHMPHTLPLPARATVGPLGRRLLGLFVAVLALSLVGSAIGLWSLLRIGQSTDDIVQRSVSNERLVADAYRLQAINAERYKAVALSSEPEVGETLGADIAETQRQYDALIDTLAQRLARTADEEHLAHVNTQAQSFHQARAALVQARDFGLTQRIREVYATQFLPASQALLAALDALTQSQRQSIDAGALRVASWSWRAQLALVAFGALSLVLGTLLALWLVRSITRPIALASDTANRVAGLDLRHDIAGHDRDETGHMLSSLAVMQTALRHLAQQVRASVYSLHAASTDIASGNANLSDRTEEAAASLQETAAALEHVKRALQASAETAHHTEARAAQAAAQARQGQDVVAHVVQTMQDISASAHKIADITGMIDSIAFQTNILALNAAVEAARAGEQGRGFAVVAGEVRILAQRSAAAAREIKDLIGNSSQRVEEGSRQVAQAGQTMTEIVGSVRRVSDIIGEVTAAAADQRDNLGQIHQSVRQLDQMTQQNAALVEQSAAASESLREQARLLAQAVRQFKVREGEGAAGQAVARVEAPAASPMLARALPAASA